LEDFTSYCSTARIERTHHRGLRGTGKNVSGFTGLGIT
jgi:hypothetical protein